MLRMPSSVHATLLYFKSVTWRNVFRARGFACALWDLAEGQGHFNEVCVHVHAPPHPPPHTHTLELCQTPVGTISRLTPARCVTHAPTFTITSLTQIITSFSFFFISNSLHYSSLTHTFCNTFSCSFSKPLRLFVGLFVLHSESNKTNFLWDSRQDK